MNRETRLDEYVGLTLRDKPDWPDTPKVRSAPTIVRTINGSGKVLQTERFWCLPSATDPRPRGKE